MFMELFEIKSLVFERLEIIWRVGWAVIGLLVIFGLFLGTPLYILLCVKETGKSCVSLNNRYKARKSSHSRDDRDPIDGQIRRRPSHAHNNVKPINNRGIRIESQHSVPIVTPQVSPTQPPVTPATITYNYGTSEQRLYEILLRSNRDTAQLFTEALAKFSHKLPVPKLPQNEMIQTIGTDSDDTQSFHSSHSSEFNGRRDMVLQSSQSMTNNPDIFVERRS